MALRLGAAFLAWTEREAYLVAIGAMYAIVLVWLMPFEVVQDTWLTLVGGREIAANGLPTHDSLTVMTNGARWVEQQWAAKLGFYGLMELGGLTLALLVHVAVLTGTFAGAMWAARSLGASRTAVFWVAAASMFVSPWAWQMRSQTFAFPLFVALLWLLVSDARSPSRRVLLVVPLLAVWSNVHGSVVLAAALVGLRALTLLRPALRRAEPAARLRAVVMLTAPALCLVASPYGLSLVAYYRSLIFNPAIGRYVDEWAPSTFPRDWAFFTLAGAALWLASRARCSSGFEKLALLATIASALAAGRNSVWFCLCVLVVLPAMVDEVWRVQRFEAPKRIRAVVWLARANVAFLVALVASTVVLDRDAATRYPTTAAAKVAEVAAADASVRVLASDRYADWLLWMEPGLSGRVAYDVRFEMFTPAQFRRLAAFQARLGQDWKQFANGYRLVVIDRRANVELERAFRREPGARLLYRDRSVAVVLRSPAEAGAPPA
jgi:hypothetical protein